MDKKSVDFLCTQLEIMYAVELLEYHDKNLLAFDNKRRSEGRLETLVALMKFVREKQLGID